MSVNKLQVLLADDDSDDCKLFAEVLETWPFPVNLTTVSNGAVLMSYLLGKLKPVPDVIFIDLNMPLQNGLECLTEIKKNAELKTLRVIIYSTATGESMLNSLYQKGAHYFIQKPYAFHELRKVIQYALSKIAEMNFDQPAREDFLLTRHVK